MDTFYTIPKQPKQSKCKWTPFAGRQVCGAVRRVVIRGEIAFIDGEVSIHPLSIDQ